MNQITPPNRQLLANRMVYTKKNKNAYHMEMKSQQKESWKMPTEAKKEHTEMPMGT